MKRSLSGLLIALTIIMLPSISSACFDTYLFLQKGGMVYPHHMLAVDGNGEYVIGSYRNAEPDMFTGGLNIYYGIAPRFSVQAVFASAEKERNQFAIDDIGLRGVYSLVQQYRGIYNLDMILEHHQVTDTRGGLYELSAPSIWHKGGVAYVLHPVVAFGQGVTSSLRGHGGIFYSTKSNALVGLGAEYESGQSSSNLGKRLIEGEVGTSLFFGTMIGPNLFLQNEIIKGWGAGADKGDLGFAFTLKFVMPR